MQAMVSRVFKGFQLRAPAGHGVQWHHRGCGGGGARTRARNAARGINAPAPPRTAPSSRLLPPPPPPRPLPPHTPCRPAAPTRHRALQAVAAHVQDVECRRLGQAGGQGASQLVVGQVHQAQRGGQLCARGGWGGGAAGMGYIWPYEYARPSRAERAHHAAGRPRRGGTGAWVLGWVQSGSLQAAAALIQPS